MDEQIINIILKYGSEIISSAQFRQTFDQTHHLNTTVGDHTLGVAYEAVKLCLVRGWTDESSLKNVVIASLCHDLGIIGRKEKYRNDAECYVKHPGDSVPIYMSVTGEKNDRVIDSIEKHMFPVKPGLPRYREGWILTLADKISSVKEKLGKQAVSVEMRNEILRKVGNGDGS